MHTRLSVWLVLLCGSALAQHGVPTFNRVDLGMSWHPTTQWTLGLRGRDLQFAQHLEFVNDFFGRAPAEIPRSVSFKLLWSSGAESK
jgi:hypothetical protein